MTRNPLEPLSRSPGIKIFTGSVISGVFYVIYGALIYYTDGFKDLTPLSNELSCLLDWVQPLLSGMIFIVFISHIDYKARSKKAILCSTLITTIPICVYIISLLHFYGKTRAEHLFNLVLCLILYVTLQYLAPKKIPWHCLAVVFLATVILLFVPEENQTDSLRLVLKKIFSGLANAWGASSFTYAFYEYCKLSISRKLEPPLQSEK